MILVNLTPLDLTVTLASGEERALPATTLAGSAAASRLATAGEDLTRIPPFAARQYPLGPEHDDRYAYIVTEFQKFAWPDRRAVYGISSRQHAEIYDADGRLVARIRVSEQNIAPGGIL